MGVAGGLEQRISRLGTESANLGYLYGKWNLFNGFRDFYENKRVSLEEEKLHEQLRIAKFEITLAVEKQFHFLLFKRAHISLKERAMSLNQSHLKYVARTRKVGLSSAAD